MTLPIETDIAIRPGLADAITTAWRRLAHPGTWWTGAERIAIAAETRQAMRCDLCRARKDALSPMHPKGDHDSLGVLSRPAIDAIHRIRTDAGRLTERWFQGLVDDGLDDVGYVEIVSVVAIVSAIDTFDRAMGLPQRPLPEPQPGAPTRHRPEGAKPGMGWLDTLAPDGATENDPDPFVRFGAYNIQRAMSLVPDAVIAFFDLDVELYFYEADFPQRAVQIDERALSGAQIELIAARTASLNGCFY